MSPMETILVLFDSMGLIVFEYSHERMAKKKAPTINRDTAIACGSLDLEYSLCACRITEMGIAICHLLLLSSALNPARILRILIPVFPLLDMRGSAAWFSKNVCATVLMVFRIEPSASSGIRPVVDVGLDLRYWANKVMIWFRSCCSNLSRNGSSPMSMEPMNEVHSVQDAVLNLLYCVVVADACESSSAAFLRRRILFQA